MIFRLIYAPEYGLLNFILEQLGLIEQQILWLSVPPLAMLSVASVDIWQWTAFVYLVLFAGAPDRAARSRSRRPRWTGPAHGRNSATSSFRSSDRSCCWCCSSASPTSLRVFDHVFILTGGGPGTTTEFLSLYLYRIAFKFSDLPQASALAVMVMVAMTVFYTVILRFLPLEAD